ncbi:hypothetical protein [Nocardioides stalactiti]|uniref:hypothetical protein n=1 Tax=Nocardioides stalactiti TaxID=2755356 RepID=UPI001602724D|nr:hypothetical protein [Nocardioides stalactiti]
MRNRSGVLATVVLSLLALACSGLVGVPPASAGPAVAYGPTVALAGYRDLWVSEATGQVAVLQASKEVVVTDSAGAVSDRIALPSGGASITGADDGSAAYVALSSGSGVVRIDLTTGATSKLALTDVPACISDLAFTDGSLWLAYGCAEGKGIVAIDPASGTQVEVSTAGVRSFSAVPSVPGMLVGISRAYNPEILRFAAIGGDSPSLVRKARENTSGPAPVDIHPDGTRLVSPEGIWSLPGLQRDYDADGEAFNEAPRRAAFSGTGLIALGHEGYDDVGAYVRVYEAGSYYRPYAQYRWQTRNILGLDFGPAGQLYVVTDDGGGELTTITPRPGSTITGDADVIYPAYGETITITGEVTSPSTNERVEVHVEEPGRPRRRVATTTADASGDYTVSYTAVRNHVVYVVYPGDEVASGSYDRVSRFGVDAGVTAALRGYDRIQGGIARYGPGDVVGLRGKVAPSYPGSRVSAEVGYWLKGFGWANLDYVQMRLDNRSRFAARLKVDRSLTGKTIRIRGVFGKARVQDYGYSDWLKFKVGR